MTENTATTTRASNDGALAQSLNLSEDNMQEDQLMHSGDDANRMRSIMAVAIGLVNLGTAPPPARNGHILAPSKNKNAVAVTSSPPQRPKAAAKNAKTMKETRSPGKPVSPMISHAPLKRDFVFPGEPTKKKAKAVPAQSKNRKNQMTLASGRVLQNVQLTRFIQQNNRDFEAEDAPLVLSQGAETTHPSPAPTVLESTPPNPEFHSNPPSPIKLMDTTLAATFISAAPRLPFPETLHKILSDLSNQDTVSWLPHGRGFAIHDRELFSSQILAKYFDGTKYASFVRRLKRWNFQRVLYGPEMGAYYKTNFLRDRPDLVRRMTFGINMESNEGFSEDPLSQEEDIQTDSVRAESMAKVTAKIRREVAARMTQAGEGRGETSFTAAHDVAGVKASMNVHRRNLMPHQPSKETENKSCQDENFKSRYQIQEEYTSSTQGSPNPETQQPVPEKHVSQNSPGKHIPPDMPMSHRENNMQIMADASPSLRASSQSNMKPPKQQGKYQKPSDAFARAAQLWHQKPQESMQKTQQSCRDKGGSRPNGQTNQRLKPEEYRSMSMAHSYGNTSRANGFDRNEFLSQQGFNMISPSSNEHRQCLDDIERQVLSEIPHPVLPAMSSSSPLANYLSCSNGSAVFGQMGFQRDGTNDRMSDHNIASNVTATAPSLLERHLTKNKRHFLANHEMMTKILAGSKTHKEIMMMAARDLQSRASASGGMRAAASQRRSRPPPPRRQQQHRLPREIYLHLQHQQLPLARPVSLQTSLIHPRMRSQRLQTHPSRQTRHLASPVSMLRELEERVGHEMVVAEAAAAALKISGRHQKEES